MQKILVLAALAGALTLSPSLTLALTPQEEMQAKGRVESLLADINATPTCDDWKADGKIALKILSERLSNEKTAGTLRLRAAYALGCFNDSAAGDALLKVLKDPKTPDLIRRPALHSYALSQGEKALPEIRKALKESNPLDRITAVESAAVIKSKAAKDILREQLASEKHPLVRSSIEKALGSGGAK